MEIDRDVLERATTALVPFVAAWRLSLNPEDLEEMAYAVLMHAHTDESLVDIDAAVLRQLEDYAFENQRFRRTAHDRMSPEEAVVRGVLDLLVDERYGAVVTLATDSQLSEADLREAVHEYGRRLVTPGDDWWQLVTLTPTVDGSIHVAAPLWTAEEGRSDLTLELWIAKDAAESYGFTVLTLHVL